ncbi:MAG: transposase [Deltaproteobacteria bacterium]|nr:transposase [Deltaproteobacteria bacterium]
MAALFRGKLVDGLRRAADAGEVFAHGEPKAARQTFDTAVRAAWRHRWVVQVEAPEGRDPALAAQYLARYVGGIAIARVRERTHTHVTFDGAHAPWRGPGSSAASPHPPQKGLHRVRYYRPCAPLSDNEGRRCRTLPAPRPLLPALCPPQRQRGPPMPHPACTASATTGPVPPPTPAIAGLPQGGASGHRSRPSARSGHRRPARSVVARW